MLVLALLTPIPWLHVVSDDPLGTAWRLDGRLRVNDTSIDPPGEWSWLAVGRPQLAGEWLLQQVTDVGSRPQDLRDGSVTHSPALSEPAAAAVGLREAGREIPLGLLVEARGPVAEGLPQSAIITSVDGIALTDRQAWEQARSHWEAQADERDGVEAVRDELTFRLADGRSFTTDGPQLPYEVVRTIDVAPEGLTARISFAFSRWLPVDWFRELSLGSSHGSMVALTTYVQASNKDLAQGRHIAGTGGILGDGTITPIGGLPSKAEAAHRAGAQVLLVPASQAWQLEDIEFPGMTVVPVDTLQDAIQWLEQPVT
ncbi:MAG: S16 family serine protease [Nitriliruptoraceae bacterium]